MDSSMMEAQSSSPTGGGDRYTLEPSIYSNEDILFCIDVDAESMVEMKVSVPSSSSSFSSSSVSNGRSITRLDSIKQAILLFIHSKLSINPFHRFAFASLSSSASWLRKEFSSEVESAMTAFRGLSVEQSSGKADLTQLFRIAAHEAKKSRAQNRILRVILIYCRSSVQPHYQWPVNQKTFTFDVVYLHDKPAPTNCPQKVYDSLVDALEHVSEYEGYIHESGQGLSRTLFRHMCILLSHPQQRCGQDNVDIPKSLTRKSPSTDLVLVSGEEYVPVSSQ